jgi:hypothetical protein
MTRSDRHLPTDMYIREDARLAQCFIASADLGPDACNVEAIIRRTGASITDALRVSFLRRGDAGALIGAWLDGALTFRQLARIVLIDAPGDGLAQLELAHRHASAARYFKSRAEAAPIDPAEALPPRTLTRVK